ncbi:MAG TPA: ABC transporter ATP-binding protein [Candidatus Scatomorpha merdipullorum]|uniref:ABC transporter ATP-binding protein n=1 Tax=Candidatus Scatomorpha merdipullorum TaxID=2840927 RepID=A0A9D1FD66_9FIRM|nr:ABC transporter ATP-binding protein [Candidatus Scatomorpha merdipullorum]
MQDKLLEVTDLTTTFKLQSGSVVSPVDHASFFVRKGEVVGIVGESGCGKSMTATSIIRLIPPPGKITEGRVLFQGKDVVRMRSQELSALRGAHISTIFQDPLTFLNPVYTIGRQIGETVRLHLGVSKEEARKRTLEVLDMVKIPAPERVAKSYPFELSGGMRQRVLIAIAMCCNPELIIADEPTTALDVTVQAQILSLLTGLVREKNISMILITHDMGIVADVCDRLYVMYAGQIVESGTLDDIFYRPAHPYTKALLNSVLTIKERREVIASIPGVVPDIEHFPKDCRFGPRCQERCERCAGMEPGLEEVSPGHFAKCALYRR